jgi:hypothetical protein
MDSTDATYQAEKFLTDEITKIEIWCGGALVNTVRKMADTTLPNDQAPTSLSRD